MFSARFEIVTVKVDRCAMSLGPAAVEIAALNNALWCDAVCSAHGVPGELRAGFWRNARTPPPFHSNLVTITRDLGQAEVDEQVRELSALPGLGPGWSVKDSFAGLDLAPQGFQVLFEASWIRRENTPTNAEQGRCVRLASSAELARWESAWHGDAGNAAAPPPSRQFPDALLRDPRHAFLACVEGEQIVAGAIANRSPGAVGLSNLFVVENGDRRAAWSAFASAAAEVFPGVPLNGYERGDDLLAAQAVGFEPIGALRVWTRRLAGSVPGQS